MKIALIVTWWKHSNGGGAKEFNVNFVNALQNRGHIVNVLFMEGEDNDNHKLSVSKINIPFKIIEILKSFKPDVIICQGAASNWFAVTCYKNIDHNCVLVGMFLSDFEKSFSLIQRHIWKYLVHRFDYIGFGSEIHRDGFLQKCGFNLRTSIFYIKPGGSIKYFTSQEVHDFIEKFNISDKDVLILVQGMTSHEIKARGVKLVIASLPKLLKKYPSIKLVITRKGQYSDELLNYAIQNGVEKSVIFTGDLQNAIIPLSVCDIFVYPYLGEMGMSMSIIEAMLLGKPIIFTRPGATSETIEHNVSGIIIKPTVDELERSIDYLLSNPEKGKEYGRNAMEVATNRFTWDSIIHDFEKVLER
jgi:spore coat protein SA